MSVVDFSERIAAAGIEEAAYREALTVLGATEAEIAGIFGDHDLFPGSKLWAIRSKPPGEALADYRAVVALELKERRQGVRNRLLRCGFGELHLQHMVDTVPDTTEALDHAREYMRSDKLFLVLLGGVGTGKTAAATRIAAEMALADRHATVAFLPAHGIARLGGFDEEDAARRKEVERCTLLVVDDLGSEYADAKGYFSAIFEQLVDARYAAARRTILTANLTVAGLARYSDRIRDRIRETGTVMVIGGESRRVTR